MLRNMYTKPSTGPLYFISFGIYLIKDIHLQVYKQLALGWQIGKQLSGVNPLSLSNNKNYR